MDERRGSVQRLLRIEHGSHTIEGIVAIGVFFLLMMLIVQIGFLVLARSAAGTSVEAALRKAAVSQVEPASVRQGIVRDITAVVPGAEDVVVEVSSDQGSLRATVSFRWIPPGPNLVPLTVGIQRSAVQVVPP